MKKNILKWGDIYETIEKGIDVSVVYGDSLAGFWNGAGRSGNV